MPKRFSNSGSSGFTASMKGPVSTFSMISMPFLRNWSSFFASSSAPAFQVASAPAFAAAMMAAWSAGLRYVDSAFSPARDAIARATARYGLTTDRDAPMPAKAGHACGH